MPGGRRSRLVWEVDGRTWPHREASRFVETGGLRWHVQELGPEDAPPVALVHGTGASTHSFRALAPLLAETSRVLAFDLPGHGFTAAAGDETLSLPGMAVAIADLFDHLAFAPALAVGHSAGAAILIEMALAGRLAARRIVGINSALKPIQGASLLSPFARLLFANPLSPRLLSWRARMGDATGVMLGATGSRIEPEGKALYERLFKNPAHIAGALGMMANWDLKPLQARLPLLETPLTLMVALDDRMVPPAVSKQAAARIPKAELEVFPEGGHLLHETRAGDVAAAIRRLAVDPVASRENQLVK